MLLKPNWESFGREIMEAWPDGVDGLDLQDIAVRHMVVVETTYDPAKHGADGDYGAQPGDPWFVRNYK